jgi:predicted metalloprotease
MAPRRYANEAPIGLLFLIVAVVLLARVRGGQTVDIDGSPGGFPQAPTAPPGATLPTPEEQRLVDFVSFVLDDVQTTWREEFARAGRTYRDAALVLFEGSANTGCGFASSATGPFYCPADQRVYLDLGFFEELSTRFGAPGDFAQAYVIAHEVGHHVQAILGIGQQVAEARAADPAGANDLSIRLELQADCFAGVWARSTFARGILEPGDIEEGLNAAAAVGDDRIQAAATGRIDPETWTHGSAEQRTTWLGRGFNTGDVDACDTFGEPIV